MDEWRTAVPTHDGSYEFQVMHYSLTKAPASFQRFMNKVFQRYFERVRGCLPR
jgi:hypothetical protein